MRYGLPYKGSKNGIAHWIVNNLPPGECLVDLFCGGGAVTHCAMLSGKWERFIMNDIDGRLPILFRDCALGKYTTKTRPEWISRTMFHYLKEKDAYVALVWSFGNNGIDYLYGENIEEFKHAYHILVYYSDPEPIRRYGYNIQLSHSPDVIRRYYNYKAQIRHQTTSRELGAYPFDLDSTVRQIEIERMQSIQSLQSLTGLQSLQSLTSDYRAVQIPQNAVIYCDIPYKGTNGGKYDGFDHESFYEWALEQDNIFISEYAMPEPFIEIASTKKSILSTSNGDAGKAVEKLFVNPRTYERYNGVCCDRQLTLF